MLVLLAGGGGIALGYAIALALLPDVAASLRQPLWSARAHAADNGPRRALSGLGMALLGAGGAAAGGIIKVFRLPLLSRGATSRLARRISALFAPATPVRRDRLRVAVAALLRGGGMIAGFALIAGGLFAAALALPAALAGALALAERLAVDRGGR